MGRSVLNSLKTAFYVFISRPYINFFYKIKDILNIGDFEIKLI